MNFFLYAVPFAICAATLGAARLFAGDEGWVKYSAVAVAASFLAGWAVVFAPGWIPHDDQSRIGHIVGGAALVGLTLDVFWPSPLWRRLMIGGFAAGCAWFSVFGSLNPGDSGAADFARFAVLAAAWIFLSLRMIAVQGHPPTGLAIVFSMLAGVAAVAMAAGVGVSSAGTAGLLGSSVLALAIFVAVFGSSVSPGAALVVTAGIMALAWTVGGKASTAWIGPALLLFIPFADRTARRVPMPQGGIAGVLYVLALIAMAAIPIVLAAILASITAIPTP